jgi:hypothetical protein
MTRKIRTALAVLAAAFTVGVVAGPIATNADAKPNTGNYAKSGEAMKLKKAQRCNGLQAGYNSDTDFASSAWEQGRYAEAHRSDDHANETKRVAAHEGCAWAL